jgi:Ser/Thr protein kinase RdoA (MazF antagonist)
MAMPDIARIARAFTCKGTLQDYRPYGNGHINDTYLMRYAEADGTPHAYILQRINHQVFTHPMELMENIQVVTHFLRKKVRASGGDPHREVLRLIPTFDGDFCICMDGNYWRCVRFISGCYTVDFDATPEDFYQSGVAFGQFQQRLADFPSESLYETIPYFHDTPRRLEALCRAAKEDVCGRAASVAQELAFAMARMEETSLITSKLESGELPLRVTHNDTKLNNILLDEQDHRAVCVLDLDTVMPGSALYDYGDAIRSGASTAAEDETDLSKVHLDPVLFESFTRGFLEGTAGSLTQTELDLLPMGAKLMTLECGIRFLTDYLQNDVYFKTDHPTHNLERCHTQFTLVAEMEQNWEQLQAVVSRLQQELFVSV